jgi:hypothetical protein
MGYEDVISATPHKSDQSYPCQGIGITQNTKTHLVKGRGALLIRPRSGSAGIQKSRIGLGPVKQIHIQFLSATESFGQVAVEMDNPTPKRMGRT